MPKRSTTFYAILAMTILVTGMTGWTAAQAQEDKYAGIRERLDDCSVCHGEDNEASGDPEVPVLAGQEMYYLYVQLKDFKAGRRANAIMSVIANTMEKAEMKLVATYFSEQEWPNIHFKGDPAKVAAGETAANSGQCVACHLGSYTGASRIPRLAGQHPEYLLKTMLDFKHQVRKNSPAIATLLASFSDDELANMAEFMGDM